MPAYLISDLTVLDQEAFDTYRTRAAEVIVKYGGRYLVRGGAIEVVEGVWKPNNLVVVVFPSLERLKAWYQSPEYAYALQVREIALTRNLIFVDGVNSNS